MSPTEDGSVRAAFERDFVTVSIDAIVPLKNLRQGALESGKYGQILCSIKAIGLVEAPAVIPAQGNDGRYYLLDGHLRIEALKQLGIETVECLLATEEDTYTYNKRLSRLPPVQEHRMIVRAVERGTAPAQIAEALGLEEDTIIKRFRLLDGISPDVAERLKDTSCSIKVFDILRRMSPLRQIEAADLMAGQNNFSSVFASALLAATPPDQLIKQKTRPGRTPTPDSQQIARMERELAVLQGRITSVEDSYGIDNLHLTLARTYLSKLLANGNLLRWLTLHRQDYLAEFERIAEIESLTSPADPITV